MSSYKRQRLAASSSAAAAIASAAAVPAGRGGGGGRGGAAAVSAVATPVVSVVAAPAVAAVATLAASAVATPVAAAAGAGAAAADDGTDALRMLSTIAAEAQKNAGYGEASSAVQRFAKLGIPAIECSADNVLRTFLQSCYKPNPNHKLPNSNEWKPREAYSIVLTSCASDATITSYFYNHSQSALEETTIKQAGVHVFVSTCQWDAIMHYLPILKKVFPASEIPPEILYLKPLSSLQTVKSTRKTASGGVEEFTQGKQTLPKVTFVLKGIKVKVDGGLLVDKYMFKYPLLVQKRFLPNSFIDICYGVRNTVSSPSCYRIKTFDSNRILLIVGDAPVVFAKLLSMMFLFASPSADVIHMAQLFRNVVQTQPMQERNVLHMTVGQIWMLDADCCMFLDADDYVIVPKTRVGALVCMMAADFAAGYESKLTPVIPTRSIWADPAGA